LAVIIRWLRFCDKSASESDRFEIQNLNPTDWVFSWFPQILSVVEICYLLGVWKHWNSFFFRNRISLSYNRSLAINARACSCYLTTPVPCWSVLTVAGKVMACSHH